MLMVWIFILAGAFAQSAKQMGAIDATVNLTLHILPDNLLLAGIFIAACFISLSIGTSVGTIVALTPVAVGLAEKTGIDLLHGRHRGGRLVLRRQSFLHIRHHHCIDQDADCVMRDKFRVNFMIVVPAALVVLGIYIFQGLSVSAPPQVQTIEWIKVIPYLIVLGTAVAGMNVMLVLLLGIFSIGIIGICGWGGMALNAATIDTRIKATVTSTMYDMSRVNANGYFDSMNADQRHELRRQLNEQRTIDTKNGSYALTGGVVDPLPDDVPWFVKDYHNYYKTDRGYHKRSLNSNGGWNKTSALSFINMPLLTYSDEIRSAVLMIHGEKAHSRYFSEDAFKKLTGDNKELLILPGANHVDLYDNLSVIPFDKIEHFFHKYLK